MGRYRRGTYLAIQKFAPLLVELDQQPVFKGFIEKRDPIIDKTQNAYIYKIEGRADFGALFDVVASKHVINEDANLIATEIIKLYQTMISGSQYSSNPVITVGKIGIATGAASYSRLWKRQAIQDMHMDLSNFLGSSTTFGGLNTYYDFWVDPTDAFYFVEAGSLSSEVDLGDIGQLEMKETDYTMDDGTVKNDLWTWASNTAASSGLGRIPLTMQPGYSSSGLLDSWTENNASDYGSSLANYVVISDDTTTYIIGKASIKIIYQPAQTGTIPWGQYWYMAMPFGSGGSKWPGQPPYTLMNAYNEAGPGLNETDGQMSALIFLMKAQDTLGSFGFNFKVEVVDTLGNIADSPNVPYVPTTQNNGWTVMQIPFGPEANYSYGSAGINWAGIAQIRYIPTGPSGAVNPTGALTIWFDGFAIVKPLVVDNKDPSATMLRTQTQVLSGLLSWAQAKLYGQATLEQLLASQQYYTIKNIGRADIPAGYTFQLEDEGVSKTLVAREVEYKFNKKDGWEIDVKGFEAT
jgi:hypothetical protein